MPNPEYQRLLRCNAAQLRERLPGTGEDAAPIGELLTSLEDDALQAAIRNLGGHDLQAIGEAFAAIDDTRPTVIFAYTVKGYGLATEGHPQNHSSLLTAEQMASLAAQSGMSLDSPWQRFDPASPAGAVCAAAARRLARDPVASHPVPSIPTGHRPHPGREGHHTGRAGARPARPEPLGSGGRRSGSSRCARTSRRRRTWAAG